MSKKLAWQKWFWGDYLSDKRVALCSLGARGLWMEMLGIMCNEEPHGYLKVGRKVILPRELALLVGAPLDEVERYLDELDEVEVYSRDGDGCIFSRRMVRDEEVRRKRAAGGFKGGNPDLMRRAKDNLPAPSKDNLEDIRKDNPRVQSPESRAQKKNPPSPRKRGRVIPSVKIPEALQAIGIDRDAFEERVRSMSKTKPESAWQKELDRLAPLVAEVGGAVVLEVFEDATSGGWQGCTPAMVRERAAKAKGVGPRRPEPPSGPVYRDLN